VAAAAAHTFSSRGRPKTKTAEIVLCGSDGDRGGGGGPKGSWGGGQSLLHYTPRRGASFVACSFFRIPKKRANAKSLLRATKRSKGHTKVKSQQKVNKQT
jgi:hypothetical protein